MDISAVAVDLARPRQKHEWSAERTAKFLSLHAAGKSASQIAAELGEGVTRNAVIGKSHRLGLNWKSQARYVDAAALRERRERRLEAKREYEKKVISGGLGIKARRINLRNAAPPVEDKIIPLEQRKTLMELEACHCRWPVGEVGAADFFFCGAVPEKSQPYCAGHCGVAHSQGGWQTSRTWGVGLA